MPGEVRTVGGTTTTQAYTYPGTSNRLASITVGGTAQRSFAYDAAGSITGDTRSGTACAYTINDAGRIAQLSVAGPVKANYRYDDKNRLSVRQPLNMVPAGTTHFISDKHDRLLAETDGAGTTIREYVWVGDMPVAVLDGTSTPTNPTLLFVHTDPGVSVLGTGLASTPVGAQQGRRFVDQPKDTAIAPSGP